MGRPAQDITGQKFGKLTVLERDLKAENKDNGSSPAWWKVKCDCGVEKSMRLQSLKKAKSCGCIGIEIARQGHLDKGDISGKTFGNIYVIKRVGSIKETSGANSSLWLIKCKLCNNQKEMRASSIKKAESCGCLKIIDARGRAKLMQQANRNNAVKLEGKVVGLLTIIRTTGKETSDGRQIYQCKCDCGNDCEISRSYLLTPQYRDENKSCGCLGKQIKKEWQKENQSGVSAAGKKRATNTSGYIGVNLVKEYIAKNGAIQKAYIKSALKHQGISTTIGKYKVSEKGFLEGAIDRDLYIIEKNLPHTRNFSDEDLSENIYLFEDKRKGIIIEKTKKDFIEILKNKILLSNK